jgi:hypothetical protein
VAALQRRYGAHALRPASDLAAPAPPPAITTGFAQLDALTGCQGIPLGALTLLSGRTTSGKTTLAFKTLAHAQQPERPSARRTSLHNVALLDLNHTCDPDYLARCGVDLAHLLIVRPPPAVEAVALLLDLVRQHQLRAIVVNSLTDLTYHRAAYQRLNAALPHLAGLVRTSSCALLWLDDPSPPWLRWLNWDRSWALRRWAALHLELHHESWLTRTDQFVGYTARARVLKRRWPGPAGDAALAITFNGTVHAGPSW